MSKPFECENFSSTLPTIKVILVGNAAVGKTCLISSFLSQPFDNQVNSTVAPSYNCADITRADGRTVSLQVWDTAGQERYHSVGKLFYRDADVAIVCYDAQNKESFDAIPMWISSIREEVENVKVCLVLTKCDLLEQSEIKQNEMEANGVAVQYGAERVFITSAKENIGVKSLFNDVANMCMIPFNSESPLQLANEEKKEKCC